MTQTLLERFVPIQSPIHALDPRVKLLATAGFAIGNALLPDGAWLAFAAAWLCVLTVSSLARLGAGFAARRAFIVLPFTLAAASVLFATPGHVVWHGALGRWPLVITGLGVARFLSLVLRAWLGVQLAVLLAATTSFPDLIHALRHLRVPAVCASILAFMYRYLFVLAGEATRLMTARSARSAGLPGVKAGGGLAWRAQVAGGMGGQLVVRSLVRADRVYGAMVARGYQGELLTMNPHELHRKDWLAGGLVLGVLGLIQALGHLV